MYALHFVHYVHRVGFYARIPLRLLSLLLFVEPCPVSLFSVPVLLL